MTILQADILHCWDKIGIHNKTYIARLCCVSLSSVKRVIKGKRHLDPTRPPAEKREVRVCLRCDMMFNSAGNGNRLCIPCQGYAERRSYLT